MNLQYIYNQLESNNILTLKHEILKELKIQESLKNNVNLSSDKLEKLAIERLGKIILKPKKYSDKDYLRTYNFDENTYFTTGFYALKYNFKFDLKNDESIERDYKNMFEKVFNINDFVDINNDVDKIKLRAKLQFDNKKDKSHDFAWETKHLIKIKNDYYNTRYLDKILNLMVNKPNEFKISNDLELCRLYMSNDKISSIMLPLRIDKSTQEKYLNLYGND